MTYIVHMLAFCEPAKGCGPTVIRPVRVPAESLYGATRPVELGQIFKYGQNDFCEDKSLTQTMPSVSAGDVVEFPDGELWQFEPVGCKKISREEFDAYCQMDRRDRFFHQFG